MTGAEFLNVLAGPADGSKFGILDKNKGDTKFRATVLDWLNLILKDISNRQQNWHWRWLEETATAPTVEDQIDYDPPTDLDTNKIFKIYDRTQDRTYEFVPFNQFREQYPDPSTDTGNPRIWTYFDGQIKLFPVPSSVFQIYIEYIQTITNLADNTNSTEVPVKYDQVIIDGVLTYSYRFDRDLGDLGAQVQLYEAGIQRMIKDNLMTIDQKGRTRSHRDRWGQPLIDGFNSILFPLKDF